MPLELPELDEATRRHMLEHLDAELANNPYVPTSLSPRGRAMWPSLVRDAVNAGDDTTLLRALQSDPGLFEDHEVYIRDGIRRTRQVNKSQAAERLATAEFNTWYVRGFSARLNVEGVEHAEIYRASKPKWSPASCSAHEGQIVSVVDVFNGHRAKYWPEIDETAFSVPYQPGCHHSIRRIPTESGANDA